MIRQSKLVWQRGFTLIELLIALAVMAIFALMAYRGLDSVLRLHQGAYAHEQQAQAIDRVITQFEADVRQASRVQASMAPSTANNADPRVRILITRRVEGQASTIEWRWDNNHLIRIATGTAATHATTYATTNATTSSASNLAVNTKPLQTATLLSGVSTMTWLQHLPGIDDKPGTWQTLSPAAIVAQPNQTLAITRGVGLKLTVAGRSIEKVFLIGR